MFSNYGGQMNVIMARQIADNYIGRLGDSTDHQKIEQYLVAFRPSQKDELLGFIEVAAAHDQKSAVYRFLDDVIEKAKAQDCGAELDTNEIERFIEKLGDETERKIREFITKHPEVDQNPVDGLIWRARLSGDSEAVIALLNLFVTTADQPPISISDRLVAAFRFMEGYNLRELKKKKRDVPYVHFRRE